MRNEYSFEILRPFLEECSMERFGKVRIEQFHLIWVLMRKRSNFWDEKRIFLTFWNFFRGMFDGTVWKSENSWNKIEQFLLVWGNDRIFRMRNEYFRDFGIFLKHILGECLMERIGILRILQKNSCEEFHLSFGF